MSDYSPRHAPSCSSGGYLGVSSGVCSFRKHGRCENVSDGAPASLEDLLNV